MAGRIPLALAAGLLLLGACSTKRTLTIHSDPPGAKIWVNGEAQGQTPHTIDFVHYGTFDIRLEKQGYESFAREVLVPTQIDGYPIVDLPFELMVRGRHFAWSTKLKPISATPSDEELRSFLDSARAFRTEAKEKTNPDNLPEFGREKEPFDPVSPGAPPSALPRPCPTTCPPAPCPPGLRTPGARSPPPPPPPPAPPSSPAAPFRPAPRPRMSSSG